MVAAGGRDVGRAPLRRGGPIAHRLPRIEPTHPLTATCTAICSFRSTTPTCRSRSSATPSPSRARSAPGSPSSMPIADAARSLRGDAEVLRLTARDEYEYAYLGKARELLTKAETAARALGVPCESRHAVSDRPAQAIVEAARAVGCDLIFMASHGQHGKIGMAFASEMMAVLMNARLPVLVSSIGELAAPARAIGIIRDEHRSLATVMHAGDACPGRGAQGRRRRRSGVDGGDRPLRPPVPARSAPSQGGGASVPAFARADRQLPCRARRARAPACARS